MNVDGLGHCGFDADRISSADRITKLTILADGIDSASLVDVT